MNSLPKKEILGVGITSATEDEILEYIFDSIKKPHENFYVVTPNPEILMYAQAHPEFMKVLNKAEIALCDGVGVSAAGKLLGKPIKERATGVDLVDAICRRASHKASASEEKTATVGLLGAGKGIALKTSERLMRKYPGLSVEFIEEEWDPKYLTSAKLRRTDILFVAFGFPKQEEWMAAHVEVLPVKVMMGVGGAFDFISGSVPRAPKLIRSVGLEWLYRLIRQPWRIKRQLVLPQFLILVLREKFS